MDASFPPSSVHPAEGGEFAEDARCLPCAQPARNNHRHARCWPRASSPSPLQHPLAGPACVLRRGEAQFVRGRGSVPRPVSRPDLAACAIALGDIYPLLFRLPWFDEKRREALSGALFAANAGGGFCGALTSVLCSCWRWAASRASAGRATARCGTGTRSARGTMCTSVTVRSVPAPRSCSSMRGGVTTVVKPAAARILLTNGEFQGNDRRETPAQMGFALVPILYLARSDGALVIGLGRGLRATVVTDAGFGHIDIAELAPGIIGAAPAVDRMLALPSTAPHRARLARYHFGAVRDVSRWLVDDERAVDALHARLSDHVRNTGMNRSSSIRPRATKATPGARRRASLRCSVYSRRRRQRRAVGFCSRTGADARLALHGAAIGGRARAGGPRPEALTGNPRRT
jgi:hypothetical protein